ncbi:MAG: sugar transferase [Chloroflexota bacterium]|nr:sugar transferase [Chloroflexota bacterium]
MEHVSRQATAVGAVPTPRLLYSFVKRAVDIVASLLALIVLSPVLLLIALAIWLDSGLPILYRCERTGRYGQPMVVLKFRTMRDGSHRHLEELLTADEEKRLEYGRRRKLRNDPRRTRVGAVLRRTSLDELPQLVNVLAGRMSLVGPRPYLPGELASRPEANEILRVRPGMTGLWQINGRSDRTFEERIGLDVDYVRQRSPVMDAAIVLRTFAAVISGRGAY